MDISGLEINANYLPNNDKDTPTGYFCTFMKYCIDNYSDRILRTPELSQYFSLLPNDPVFKSAVARNCVVTHNNLHFSTNSSTAEKIGIMYHIANLLRIGLYVYTH